jgi:hypothetical protein
MWVRVEFRSGEGWIARCALKVVQGRLSMLERVDTAEAAPQP